MSIQQTLYRTANRRKRIIRSQSTSETKNKIGSQSTSEAKTRVQLTELVDKLLAKLRTQGSLQHFSWVVQNNPNLQAELTKVTDKNAFVEKLLELAKIQGGYKFTAQEVMTIPGTWSANSVEELISVFYNLTQGSLEHFLTEVEKDPVLQQKLNEELQTVAGQENLAKILAQFGKAEGYDFKAKDVLEITP